MLQKLLFNILDANWLKWLLASVTNNLVLILELLFINFWWFKYCFAYDDKTLDESMISIFLGIKL